MAQEDEERGEMKSNSEICLRDFPVNTSCFLLNNYSDE